MKVLLLEDVYKLGRAGDVKKVAPGYARNFLMPQGLAVLATPGAVKQAGRITKHGEVKRTKVNQELGGVAEQLAGKRFTFAAKASETRRLYGSINTQMIAEAVSQEIGVTVEPRQIESQPLRMLGRHNVSVRLTVDLIPEIEIIVHREGESPESALAEEERAALQAEEALAEILEEEAAGSSKGARAPKQTDEDRMFEELDSGSEAEDDNLFEELDSGAEAEDDETE
jgi:large subunit ribosomal protein L9